MLRRRIYFKILSFIYAVLFLSACNTYKYVPENSYYVGNVKIKMDNKVISKEELQEYISQKPNKQVLGMKVHLFIYNLSNPNKDKKFQNYLRNVGEKPVIWDSYQTKKSTDQLKRVLAQDGYFKASVKDSLVYKNKRKLNVVYYISPKVPYKINSFVYNISDENIKRLVYNDSVNRKVEIGARYEITDLLNERNRIEKLVRDSGYYEFSKENYISYIVDTVPDKKVIITIEISDLKDKEGESIEHSKFLVRDIYIFRNYNPKLYLDNPDYVKSIDTLKSQGINFLSVGDVKIKPGILVQSNYILPENLFNQRNEELTFKHISSLKIFRNVEINYSLIEDTVTSEGYKLLNCYINLIPLTRQYYQLEASGTNSSGNLGGETSIKYQYKNLLGNAEILDVTLKGASESLFLELDTTKSNSTQIGIETMLHIPKFLAPLRTEQFIKKYSPSTTVALSYKYRNRPGFEKQRLANFTFGYNWKGNKYNYHSIDLLKFNFVNIDTVNGYNNKVVNYAVFENDLSDKLITSIHYTYEYSNKSSRALKDFVYFRYNFEPAGSILNFYTKNIDKKNTEDSLFGVPFSQFILSDFDFRYYNIKTPEQTIVYRFFAGIVYPYGNSPSVPAEYRYIMGGPNSMRAWRSYYLGPGLYTDTLYKTKTNGSSDIKLEFNAEYRFDIVWKLEGAFFVDCGNIWSVSKNEQREGAKFEFNKFYKQIAIGAGFGTRFDFDFLIVRFDWGFKIHNPAGFSGEKVRPDNPNPQWIFDKTGIEKSDYAIQFGVAYPF